MDLYVVVVSDFIQIDWNSKLNTVKMYYTTRLWNCSYLFIRLYVRSLFGDFSTVFSYQKELPRLA